MECDTNNQQRTSDDRRPSLSLGRYDDVTGELPRNGKEQEYDACDHQNSWNWCVFQCSNSILHYKPIYLSYKITLSLHAHGAQCIEEIHCIIR